MSANGKEPNANVFKNCSEHIECCIHLLAYVRYFVGDQRMLGKFRIHWTGSLNIEMSNRKLVWIFSRAKTKSRLTLPLTHPREYWNVWAIQHKVSVHNNIMGSTRDAPILEAIISYAIDKSEMFLKIEKSNKINRMAY